MLATTDFVFEGSLTFKRVVGVPGCVTGLPRIVFNSCQAVDAQVKKPFSENRANTKGDFLPIAAFGHLPAISGTFHGKLKTVLVLNASGEEFLLQELRKEACVVDCARVFV